MTGVPAVADQPTTTDVIVRPAMTVDEAVQQLGQIREFRARVLQEGVDYGVIPGTGTKPTLLKPGAEKLAQLFGFSVEFERGVCVENWDQGFFSYAYWCVVRQRGTGAVIARSEGSCNSREDKYRYRVTPEWQLPDEIAEREQVIGGAVFSKVKNTRQGPRTFYYFENTEPFSLVNTLQKMAQKRAMIGSMLIATRASEEFTQDVEDMADYPGSADAPPAPREAEPATEKQVEFMRKLMGRHFFSDEDRAESEAWIASEHCNKATMSEKIDQVQKVIEVREKKEARAKEQGEAKEAPPGDQPEDEQPAELSPKDLRAEIDQLFADPNLPEVSRELWDNFYKGMKRKPKDLDEEVYVEELTRLRDNLLNAIAKAPR
jgi:hypothetical protein